MWDFFQERLLKFATPELHLDIYGIHWPIIEIHDFSAFGRQNLRYFPLAFNKICDFFFLQLIDKIHKLEISDFGIYGIFQPINEIRDFSMFS